jgi:hypothetical protein
MIKLYLGLLYGGKLSCTAVENFNALGTLSANIHFGFSDVFLYLDQSNCGSPQ